MRSKNITATLLEENNEPEPQQPEDPRGPHPVYPQGPEIDAYYEAVAAWNAAKDTASQQSGFNYETWLAHNPEPEQPQSVKDYYDAAAAYQEASESPEYIAYLGDYERWQEEWQAWFENDISNQIAKAEGPVFTVSNWGDTEAGYGIDRTAMIPQDILAEYHNTDVLKKYLVSTGKKPVRSIFTKYKLTLNGGKLLLAAYGILVDAGGDKEGGTYLKTEFLSQQEARNASDTGDSAEFRR